MISIKDYFQPECVMFDVEAEGKPQLLARMLEPLTAMGHVTQPEAALERLLERERLMTTAVKPGFAFPHTFHDEMKTTVLAMAVARRGGWDFEALDGKPVQVVFLLLGPHANQSIHLRLLARISRITAVSGVLSLLVGAETPEAIHELILNTEKNLPAMPDAAP